MASGDIALIRGWLNSNFDNCLRGRPSDPVIHESLITWFEETIAAMHRGLDRADRYDERDRRARCVMAFGQFEYTAHRYFSLGWRTPRADVLRNMTDSWAYLLTERGLAGPAAADA